MWFRNELSSLAAVSLYYILWECACSLRYPACNEHAAYYIVICVLPRSAILLHIISQKARISKKKKINIKCVFIFCITFGRIISRSTSNWAMNDVKRILVSIWSTRYLSSDLMKLEFSWWIFEKKSLNIKISESHEVWVELFHVDGWTDRHDEVNIRLSQFWESAYNRC